MKKHLALVLALTLVLLLLPGCNTGSTADTGATETEEPEVFVSSTLIENGASDYVIVHDGSSETRT